MKLSARLLAEREFVENSLADSVICEDCKATLHTYADLCSASLGDACPGFQAIESAKAEFDHSLAPATRLRGAAGKEKD